jgi:transposase
MWVILDRDSGDFTRTRRLGLARFEASVRREITRRGGQRPCLRIARKLFQALADETGVIAHRPGALERVQLLLEDWADTQRKLADTETRMVAERESRRMLLIVVNCCDAAPRAPRASAATCPSVKSSASFTTATGVAPERGGTDHVDLAKG